MGKRSRNRQRLGKVLPAASASRDLPAAKEERSPERAERQGRRPLIAAGAPVGDDRGWALDEYFAGLRRQTVQPDYCCFVVSDGAPIRRQLVDQPDRPILSMASTQLPFFPREGEDGRNADPDDMNRARHFSALRNELKTLFLRTDADVFLSIDTDIILEDETAIERMLAYLLGPRAENPRGPWGWDVVCAKTSLHPNEDRAQCWNAGFWMTSDTGTTQAWRRAEGYEAEHQKSPVRIDIPMACYLIRRHALGSVSYRPHEQGEDMGFAQGLQNQRFRVCWATDVPVRHVWGPSYLNRRTG